ncbi:hypothetical protein [Devosia sp. FKR38]|uniref:hypothetical protein n=1 Tax=Devosia sp. FKR38 TaxID=2562312 RepID=UPI0010C131E6|nr:hypothetical protein [Devosia sp. FKR38]
MHYVAYYFMYVRRRPQSKEEINETLKHQYLLFLTFNKLHKIAPIKSFYSILTNRDRHFAETEEFRNAVAFSLANEVALVVADLQTLLERTHPDRIDDAIHKLFSSGVTIKNAATGGEVGYEIRSIFAANATARGKQIRNSIRKGLLNAETQTPPLRNQRKAAAGARRAADKRAERLRETVADIKASLGLKDPVSPTRLASELNSRNIPTPQGKIWTAAGAKNLLIRLGGESLSP